MFAPASNSRAANPLVLRASLRRAGWVFSSLIVLLAVAMPAGASAHVRLLPEEAEAGAYTVLRVNVPNESPDSATTKVVVEFPPGFTYALYRPIAGWSGDVKMTKSAKSIIDGKVTPARVTRVTWSAEERGAVIQPEQFEEFPIAVQIPDRPGDTLTFKATQTYENGDVVRWVGAPSSQAPAPQVLVTAAGEDQGGGVGEDATAEEDSGDESGGLVIVALIVGILGLLVGTAALIRLLRASGGTPNTNQGSEMATQSKIISGTDFITVSTQDYERAARFYGETLGLEFAKRWGDMPAGEFETGNLTIAVMQSDAFGIEFRANNHPIEFHVEDFEAAKAELESRGIEFRGDTLDSGVCHQAFFADPDGNALAIHHRYAPPSD
jgi:periplasmic copper chaperone A